ncbi:MAG: hypothetical protein GTO17_04515 [Candidatus Aminicenantes bacterium]|nr:hypothetical protein [Candidatus Aminicenantes bacterium]
MSFNISKQRLYASLLVLGAGFLFFRTIMMLSQGALDVLVLWASALLIAEMLLDAAWLLSSVRWWITNDKNKDRIPLRLGAAAVLFHAVRVLVFVLGRIGPWIDFDVRPVHRALHAARWNWEGVYFAAIMSALSVIGVVIIWIFRRRAKKRSLINNQRRN